MVSSNKICIFCGDKPDNKNKEHVIPRWLMDYIGISGGKVRFGFDRENGKPREFVYKAFTFPACEKCNLLFSDLERKTKSVLVQLLSENELSKADFLCLLDWFDKVRIGLWLGFYYLDKNYGGISPKFHIQTRISSHDRMLHIVKVENEANELSFRGCDSLSFRFTPSCFSMIINNFCFYNISSPFLVARRLGFPYPAESYMRKDGLADYLISPARKRIMRPLLTKPFAFSGVGIYQPIYRDAMVLERGLYDNEYVKDNSISFKDGQGDIFIQSNENVKAFPSTPARSWIPHNSYKRRLMNPYISINTLEYQLYIYSQHPSTSRLEKKERDLWKSNFANAKEEASWFIKTMKNNAKKGIF